jgi:hypothetical protein
LTASESLSNTGLDMTTTALSALATAFSPLATVHALTAGASISSGWKTAVDTDVFAKASIANYAEAIQLSYYQNIHNLIQKLPSNPDEKVNASLILAEVQEIHQGCSLGSAQQTVSKTLQDASKLKQGETQDQGGSQLSTSSNQLISVNGPFKKNDDVLIVATSQQLAGAVVQIDYKVASQTSILYVANAVATKITTEPSFASAKIAANVRTSGAAVFLELTAPAGTTIKWNFIPTEKFGTVPSQSEGKKKVQSIILPGESLLGH